MKPDEKELADYYVAQAHRKASEEYISATRSDIDAVQAIYHCDRAEAYGRTAFSMARTTLQRAAEYNFLMAVAGIRVLIEMNYESVVTSIDREVTRVDDERMTDLLDPENLSLYYGGEVIKER